MNMSHSLMTAVFLLCVATGANGQLVPPPPDGGIDPDEVVVSYPFPAFASLQDAIDATPEGGRLIIAPGRFYIPDPLIINKRIAIEGAGCRLASRINFDAGSLRSMSRELRALDFSDRQFTRLIGVRPTDVAEPDASEGVLNFVGAGAGGSVTGLEIVGGDAGIQVTNLPDASDIGGEPGDADDQVPLAITDSCLIGNARGVHLMTTAPMTMVRLVIKDVIWNGISHYTPLRSSAFRKVIDNTMHKLVIYNAANACLAFYNLVAATTDAWLVNCGKQSSLGAIDSHVSAVRTHIINGQGPGMALVRSSVYFGNGEIDRATGFGVVVSRSHLQMHESLVAASRPFSGPFPFGDGIAAVNDSSVFLYANHIEDSHRAGIANFGSTIALQNNTVLQCSGFEVTGEDYPLPTDRFVFNDLGGNRCGCGYLLGKCVAVSTGLSPPDPLQQNQ